MLLFVESELQGREGEVTVYGGPVSVEQRRETFLANDSAQSIRGGAVVVARIEMGVVVPSLQLQSRLQDLGGNIDNRSSQIRKEAYQDVSSIL